MFQGKRKAITFSYDDGVTQDKRLVEIFNKYGLKATFNLNSGLLGQGGTLVRKGVTVDHNKVTAADVPYVYAGHEIAAHTLTHPFLPRAEDDEVVRQVEQDRFALSELWGEEVVGFAYPGGGVNFDDRVVELIRTRTGVRYARTTLSCDSFVPGTDLFRFRPTVYHHEEWGRMLELAERFLALQPEQPSILYIWGHAYEFDVDNNWEAFEEFCKRISGAPDVFYGTNREVLLGDRK